MLHFQSGLSCERWLSPLSLPPVPLLLFPYKLVSVFGFDTMPAGKWRAVKAVKVRFCHWAVNSKVNSSSQAHPSTPCPFPCLLCVFVFWCPRKEEGFLEEQRTRLCCKASRPGFVAVLLWVVELPSFSSLVRVPRDGSPLVRMMLAEGWEDRL